MTTSIIFLDDEPRTHQKLKALLIHQGYKILEPQTVEEAFYAINMQRAELVVHCAHRTQTYWSLCDKIFTQYPQFPSIHMATGPTSEIYHSSLKGPFHQKMRPLISAKDFLKRVRKLIFLGRIHHENQTLKKAADLRHRVDKLFDTLSDVDLKRGVAEFFFDEFKADNAFFIAPGSYGYYLQEMWKVKPINAAEEENRHHKHDICSAQPTTEKEFSSLLQQVTQNLPTGWELKHSVTYVVQDTLSIWMIPVIGHRSKKVLGHVMLINPLLYGDLSLKRALPSIMGLLGRHMEHVNQFSETRSLNYIDDLTDLYNQRYLHVVIDKEISRAKRNKSSFSILFMDVDHFKQVNDTMGHLVGSKILVALSRILNNNIRGVDFGFRYGGDEFIMVLVGSDSKRAAAVAERVRQEVERTEFDIDGTKIKVTLSIGIATFPEHATTKDEIIELADRAMYCGKSASRNVVYVAS